MGKLWRWERVGILEYQPQDSMMHIEFSVGFPAVVFFSGCLYYDAFFEVLKESLKDENSLPKCSKYKDR